MCATPTAIVTVELEVTGVRGLLSAQRRTSMRSLRTSQITREGRRRSRKH